MRLPTALALMLAGSAPLAALEPLNPPAPLSPAPAATSPGESALALLSAQRAQALGFPSTAVTLYRALIAAPGADTGRLTLALASALLDDGDVVGAGRVLDGYSGPRGAGWHLRAGLVAVPDPAALELGVVPVLGVLEVPPALALVDAEPAADFRTNTFGSVRTTICLLGKYV